MDNNQILPTGGKQEVEVEPDSRNPTVTLYDLEKQRILRSLKYFNGNKTHTAHALGITIKTLYNKLHEYGEFENFAVHQIPNSKTKS